MQHRIEATVGDLLEQAESRLERTGEPLDLMRDLAVPLPLIVIAEMLGIPPEDRASLKQWSDALARITDPVVPPSLIRDADRAVEAFTTYLEPLIAERRASPRDDLLSALVNAEQAGEQMTERELHGMCALLVAAGNETTTNLIGNGFAALFANPDQLQILRKDPGRAGEVIEEVMRYDSPVQFTTRVVAEPITVRGRRLTPGQFVMLGLAAANRDEAVFAEPDRFLVDRFRDGSNGARHLALGHGAHYCLGAALARMEGTTAFRQAIERWPQLGPAGSVTWRETFTLRGPESLPALPSGAEGSAPIPRALTPAAFG